MRTKQKILEVEKALQKLKNGKAASEDLIKEEQKKYTNWKGKEMLHRIINIAWRISSTPREWNI